MITMLMHDGHSPRSRTPQRSLGRGQDEGIVVEHRRAYAQLVRHLPTPYVEIERPPDATLDDAGSFLIRGCNAAMARHAGVLAPDDLRDLPFGAVLPLLTADLKLGLQHTAALATDDGLPDGSDATAGSLVAFALAPRRYGVLIQDAVIHQQAVEALARRARELAALHDTLLQLNAETDLHALLGTIVARASGLLDAPRGGLYLLRDGEDLLDLAVSHGAPGTYVETALELGEGVSGRAAAEGKAVLVGAERLWEERDRAYPDAPFGPAVAVPLRLDGQVIGALYVGDDERQLAYDHGDARLLSMFADQAALVIQRTRLLERAQRDAEERAVLLREVNHRVKNNLTAIIGLLYAQECSVAPEQRGTYQDLLGTLVARVQALATAHELLSRVAWGPVSLHELASQVMGSVLGAGGGDAGVEWRVDCPASVMLRSEVAQHLAMVISELATNVARHALLGRGTRSCHLVARIEGEHLVMTFCDDGPGYPREVLQGETSGVGLDLVTNLVRRSLRGSLELANEGGALARIELPAAIHEEK